MTTTSEATVSCPPSAAFPLTCTWCRRAPATHFLVYDYEGQPRQQAMICAPCGHRTHVLPGGVTAWWLFRLVPDDPFECDTGEVPDPYACSGHPGHEPLTEAEEGMAHMDRAEKEGE